MSTQQDQQGEPKAAGPKQGDARRRRAASSLLAAGEPMLWLTGGALALCLVMIVALLALVLWRGGSTFWPTPCFSRAISAASTP